MGIQYTNHIRNFCEDCQVDEKGGWPEGIHPIKTLADSNSGNNTLVVDGDPVVGNTQFVDGNTLVEPPVMSPPLLDLINIDIDDISII